MLLQMNINSRFFTDFFHGCNVVIIIFAAA